MENKKEPKNTKAMTWVCTLNNPTQTDKDFFEGLKTLDGIKYFIGQREKGEENGTEHFQFYIEFEFAKYFKTVQKMLPSGTHIEQRKGTKSQARKYCSKTDTRIGEVYEHGEFVEERSRTDFKEMQEAIKNGIGELEFNETFPTQSARCLNFYGKFKTLVTQDKYQKVRRDIVVTYIHGSTGIGKTRYVLDKYGDENVYVVDDPKHPFDFYDNQDVILFDEFHSSKFDLSKMLRWLDRYPVILPSRYNNKVACFTKVYLTSNLSLSQQYTKEQKDEPLSYNALKRKIHNVCDFDDRNTRQKFLGIVEPTQTEMISLSADEQKNMPW